MSRYTVSPWKKAPFVRLLSALVTGILLQWNLQPGKTIAFITAVMAVTVIATFSLFKVSVRYRFGIVNGISTMLLFISLGALLTFQKDIRNQPNWFGHQYTPGCLLAVSLEEPIAEKPNSFKANASVYFIVKDNLFVPAKGKIIIYFKKDSTVSPLTYGSQLVFKKPLQPIKNAGNPGGFDYQQYSLFAGITHQVYLQPGDFEILNTKNQRWLKKFIYDSREWIIHTLQKNIKGDKELGLAEALLIGYKDDLDKDLVQSYSNTGVVHVIAISGLHLGLIYWLLALALQPLRKKKGWKWVCPVFIIAGLWLFSWLAGAQPSVLRSALMFTCIVIGENIGGRSSIINTLAFSAFMLLCINPYWLWDVGFQLSYAAVLSIIIYMKPIYNWFYIRNKWLDMVWKLNAVTIAAQILTTPVSIYHFHQFPNYFLLTNMVAVPLSSLILLGEIFLCLLFFIPGISSLIGKITGWLITCMNGYVEKIESFPFSVWKGLQASMEQTILLMLFIIGITYWLLEKYMAALKYALLSLTGFMAIRCWSFMQAADQQKVIVYNIPKHRAIDIANGRRFGFIGDTTIEKNKGLFNFHLAPSRTLYRLCGKQNTAVVSTGRYVSWYNRKIILLDSLVRYKPDSLKQTIDLVIISGNPKLYIGRLAQSFNILQIVADASASSWKLKYWKKDCDSLGIPFHDVSKGAFVMRLR